MTAPVEIAGAHLSGTNTRRVRCALAAAFGGEGYGQPGLAQDEVIAKKMLVR